MFNLIDLFEEKCNVIDNNDKKIICNDTKNKITYDNTKRNYNDYGGWTNIIGNISGR